MKKTFDLDVDSLENFAKVFIFDYIHIIMAITFESKLKKWGRSFGIVVPMDKIQRENLREDENIEILITKKKNPIEETFGTVKFNRTTQEILDESDREDWDE